MASAASTSLPHAALPDAPMDPSVAAKTLSGAYPLSLNDLTDLVSYHPHPTGLSIVSRVSLPAGAVFCAITTATPAPAKRWSTVQTSAPGGHVELNSALLYMNHSCRPTLEVDVARMLVRVARDRDLRAGDVLSFFYPASEWEFDNPFACLCAAEGCLGEVRGARYIAGPELRRWWVNEHILKLKEEQEGSART